MDRSTVIQCMNIRMGEWSTSRNIIAMHRCIKVPQSNVVRQSDIVIYLLPFMRTLGCSVRLGWWVTSTVDRTCPRNMTPRCVLGIPHMYADRKTQRPPVKLFYLLLLPFFSDKRNIGSPKTRHTKNELRYIWNTQWFEKHRRAKAFGRKCTGNHGLATVTSPIFEPKSFQCAVQAAVHSRE